MSEGRENFAKMAPGLDRNRKVRRGGADAREVYLWVLRRVAERNTDGWIPADDLHDLELVADDLMRSVTDVGNGVTRAFEVNLLLRDGEKILVTGWDETWGRRRPLSAAEKQRNYRERKRKSDDDESDSSSVTDEGNNGNNGNSVTKRYALPQIEKTEKRRESEPPVTALPDQVTKVTPPDLTSREVELATRIWFEHCDRHEALRTEFGLTDAQVRPLRRMQTTQGWRDLRERIRDFKGDLEAAEGDARHVLDVREAEARKQGKTEMLRWFGNGVWTTTQWRHAVDQPHPSKGRGQAEEAKGQPQSDEFQDPWDVQ